MADVFTLGGATLDLVATDALPVRWQERFGTVPTLSIQRRAIALPTEASDPWMGRTFVWTNGGTTYFSGRIRSRSPRRVKDVGYVIDYQAYGLRDYLDRFPLTDKTTLVDTSAFNCQPEDLANYQPSRAGRTVGQILTDVLTSKTNALNLDAYGLGNYSGLPTTPTLPSNTVSDLAALTVIPPRPVFIVGEKFGDAIDAFLQANAPNIRTWIDPSDGSLRFINITACSAHSLVQNSGAIAPVEISRDVADCWQRMEIRGAPIAIMYLLKLSQGAITEDFAWGSYTNAQAKANWTPASFQGPTTTQDVGTCTMSSTTTIVVTSSNASETWVSDFWDQSSTGTKGTINLYWTAGSGLTTAWTARIVACTSLSPAGTSTITIDVPAPHTSFDRYTITGQSNGASLVWRQYKIADSSLWPLIVQQATYAQAFSNAAGNSALVTSTPMGLVIYPSVQGGGAPYDQFAAPFIFDASTGHITFAAPTFITCNYQAPHDVWVLLPVNTGPNVVYSPQNSGSTPVYTGDSHTIEGLQDTLTMTMSDWRDPGQVAQVQAYADDYILSVKDGRREGRVTYYGLYTPALTFGNGLSIGILNDDGTTGTTGWESANIPIVETEVEWSQGALDYVTTFTVSNRRDHLAADMFLRPERTWQQLGLPAGIEGTFQAGGAISGVNGGSDLPTAAAAEGLDAMSGLANQGLSSMSDAASQGVGGMTAAGQQGLGAMTPDAWSGHGPQAQGDVPGNTWLGTTGSHAERDPNAVNKANPADGSTGDNG